MIFFNCLCKNDVKIYMFWLDFVVVFDSCFCFFCNFLLLYDGEGFLKGIFIYLESILFKYYRIIKICWKCLN